MSNVRTIAQERALRVRKLRKSKRGHEIDTTVRSINPKKYRKRYQTEKGV